MMTSINFIGGEKGGVGKSVTARVLAQYYIDRQRPLIGFDTDRSHNSFTRFYAECASPVIVDSYEGLDRIIGTLDSDDVAQRPSIIVDLASQTATPLANWFKDSDLLTLLAEMQVVVNFWHLADASKDSADLLERLVDTYGAGPNYIVVKNRGRGSDFTQIDQSSGLEKAIGFGAFVITLPNLHEASMRKIDRQNASFWAALNNRSNPDALGLLERQRVKTWLKSVYTLLDALPL